jgi:hypothetical protein
MVGSAYVMYCVGEDEEYESKNLQGGQLVQGCCDLAVLG